MRGVDPGIGCDPNAAADLLRALAHPMRLRILCRLLDGELAVSGFESELGLRQPNLSQQLGALREAGLVATRREAKSIVYRLSDARVSQILRALRSALSGAPLPVAPEPAPQVRPASWPVPEPMPTKRPQGGEAGLFAQAGWDLPRGGAAR